MNAEIKIILTAQEIISYVRQKSLDSGLCTDGFSAEVIAEDEEHRITLKGTQEALTIRFSKTLIR